ncbi:sulfur carrier protein ThiS [Oceanimonas sp. CHS3-5]|uniref:sulfur carrier protein ThiS n=1 Tax=Oceanimonas sp. CHS3-5 TaxID=3068186 RepID=UPI00273D721B|nr:sulfur carrier protein ThiS [Oceanimonas sp. CHS3-5]MDP5293207.1 sulfur carrier protein ThiS [Oceanimonas sp. CHS3-5]
MHIILNDELHPLTEGTTLAQLLAELEQDKPGVAVALNREVVARSLWAERQLEPNDNITLFHAIAGG